MMKTKTLHPKWITGIMLSLTICWVCSCSEELVLIEEVDRTKLDSIDNLILVTTDDLTAAKIAKDALKRRVDSLNAAIADANNVGDQNPNVSYTVQVVDGGTAATAGRSQSLASAVVTVSQGNTSITQTTGNTGMVTFPDLHDGIISVTVEIDGYADAYMIVDLRDNGADPNGTNSSYRNASTQVMVFPTTGANVYTISGVGYYNQNTTNVHTNNQNDPNHPYTGTQIYETVPVGSTFSIKCTPNIIPLNHGRPGRIIQVVYSGLERVATIGANGVYSVTVPVVLRTSGAYLFTYTGPHTVTPISGTLQTATTATEQLWYPGGMWPTTLPEMVMYPGGNTVTDIYFFL